MEIIIGTIIGNLIGIPLGIIMAYKIYQGIEKFKAWNYEEWGGGKY